MCIKDAHITGVFLIIEARVLRDKESPLKSDKPELRIATQQQAFFERAGSYRALSLAFEPPRSAATRLSSARTRHAEP